MTQPDMGLVTRLGRAFWGSAALNAAVRLDLFTHLADGPATAKALAPRLGADPRYLGSLMHVCAALGLLTRDGDAYANAPAADAFLVRGRPAYQGDITLHRADLWAAWDQLDAVVRRGAPVSSVPADPEAARIYWRNYIVGHHNIAQGGQAAFLVHTTDLAGASSLLDVGGGAGSYTIALCARYPALHGTVLDQPEPLELARELVHEAGLDERVTLLPGDYHAADFGRDRDAVLFSAVLCQESEDDCRRLLARAAAALRPGGVVLVQEPVDFGEPRQREPLALFDLLVLLLYHPQGGVRPRAQVEGWLAGAGLKVERTAVGPGLFNLFVARKP